jgi:hypothetical protein
MPPLLHTRAEASRLLSVSVATLIRLARAREQAVSHVPSNNEKSPRWQHGLSEEFADRETRN